MVPIPLLHSCALQALMSMFVTANTKCFLVSDQVAVHVQAFFTDTDSSSGSNPSGLQFASGRINGSKGICPLAQ